VWQHLGLYAYTLAALDWFVANPAGVYEILEGLEQLRFLENGWKIATIPVPAPEYALSGIDTEGDLALAEQAIERLGDPFPT
jgi:3-deoxy-manno-octulosonate cytidylyltransferase (CMP-KDO synthetase)